MYSVTIGPVSYIIDGLDEVGHNSDHTEIVCLPV